MIFHEETQKGKASSSYEWKESSNFSLHSYFIWATTQMRMLPLFLQYLQNGSYISQMYKHQLVQETFTISPFSSLPPWNHSLTLRTCKPTFYILCQRLSIQILSARFILDQTTLDFPIYVCVFPLCLFSSSNFTEPYISHNPHIFLFSQQSLYITSCIINAYIRTLSLQRISYNNWITSLQFTFLVMLTSSSKCILHFLISAIWQFSVEDSWHFKLRNPKSTQEKVFRRFGMSTLHKHKYRNWEMRSADMSKRRNTKTL